MIFAPNEDADGCSILYLLLEVAFEAEVGIAHGQHFGVNAAMSRMAGGATFLHRLVFKNVRPALGRVAFKTVFVLGKQGRATAGEHASLVRRMALRAFHPALGHGMMAGQLKLAANIVVALVANGFRCPGWWHPGQCGRISRFGTTGGKAERRLDFPARIRVQAARSVAGFAPGVERIGPCGNQTRVVGGLEAPVKVLMALFAFRGADVFGSGHIGKLHHLAVDGAAGDARQQQNNSAGRQHQISTALATQQRKFDE